MPEHGLLFKNAAVTSGSVENLERVVRMRWLFWSEEKDGHRPRRVIESAKLTCSVTSLFRIVSIFKCHVRKRQFDATQQQQRRVQQTLGLRCGRHTNMDLQPFGNGRRQFLSDEDYLG